MLQVKNVNKQYKTGDYIQKVLDDVSLSLRDNEFVAVLGPSGSGKTTLLNVIGGLDRYDSGDLVINGTSTKQYRDRDWDAYRNHSVGFIFQSYNLIPHQSVLANVELALTIAGVSKAERKRRAADALKRVGLADHMNKRPNQLSGGQMQRVAIARALVNEPTILLADEPTGALDSETSEQVMQLLKDVAKDRLVVMVTHNPELAHEYANRIVELKDGRIVGDSNPYTPEASEPADSRRLGKASMSFLTALGLSFNNLRTKFRRTLLVSIAGSIGIIGIALILSLSNGMNRYISTLQEDTLSEYPVEVYKTTYDFSLFTDASAATDMIIGKRDEVTEFQLISSMFSTMSSNDLKSFKNYIENNRSAVDKVAQTVEYKYDLDPLIFLKSDGKYRQVNPNNAFSELPLLGSSFASGSGFTNVFHQLPDNTFYYQKQYDVMAGRWPEKYNEMVMVLRSDGWISDMTLYMIGMKDMSLLEKLVDEHIKREDIRPDEERMHFKYKDFVGLQFSLLDQSELFVYDEERNLWIDKTTDSELTAKYAGEGDVLTIVGVVQQKPEGSVSILDDGVYYMPSLVRHVIDMSRDSGVVKAQLATPEINVLTGTGFDEEEDAAMPDLSSLFSVDTNALQGAFVIDSSYDPDGLSDAFDGEDVLSMFDGLKLNTSPEETAEILRGIFTEYLAYASADSATDYAKLPGALGSYLKTDELKKILNEELTSISSDVRENILTVERFQQMILNVMDGYDAYREANPEATVRTFLSSGEARNALEKEVMALTADVSTEVLKDDRAGKLMNRIMDSYEIYAFETGNPLPSKFSESFAQFMQSDKGKALITDAAGRMIDTSKMAESSEKNGGLAGKIAEIMQDFMQNAVRFDSNAFAKAFKLNMDTEDIADMIMSVVSGSSATYDKNLALFGYVDLETPTSIIIYPKDFESKAGVVGFIDDYNEKMAKAGEEEKVIKHDDSMGSMMGSVTKIIDAVSYVLAAFVAVSLVVSSIMIGVITYISVLERSKEIGILRAIGASKSNISSVFNAETFIIGALSGLIGIGIAELLLIPGNILIHNLAKQPDLSAYLPPHIALALIALSIVLTLIGGLIPSAAAARRDPVAALRTE